MRRILGIDPGSRITGFGIIDSDGHRSVHVASGCIRLPNSSFPERLGIIYREISKIIVEHSPQEAAIEQVFVSRNAGSALKLGQARGAAICAAVNHELDVGEYAPRSIKQSVVGNGGADKAQVQHMVKLILSISEKLSEDQSDALAIALCHAHTSGMEQKLRRAAGARRR